MKEDEKRFLIDVYNKCTTHYGAGRNTDQRYSPRELINEPSFYMNYKRAWYLLEKWGDKGWYEWGVTLDLGWLTDEGLQKAEALHKGE